MHLLDETEYELVIKNWMRSAEVNNKGWEFTLSSRNLVFYDWMQYQIGLYAPSQIAVCIVCPVVEKHPERNELIIHGGAVHFSKEFTEVNGIRTFDQVVDIQCDGWGQPIDGAYLKALAQEHGIIKASAEFIMRVEVGDLIGILPIHSCLTVQVMRSYTTKKVLQLTAYKVGLTNGY